ncbi:hypothetical protein Q5P01_009803 [Channa striata]|uniref:G-protein coupled receptors family 1 profile domain-containing protein n=1 Tax=Channa striata TaxID=64152 RepID=A0AA88SR63_CHASR|nr:hypothetical protein Q5P01_009803 [Channa striata]
MATNNSLVGDFFQNNVKLIIVQVLIMIFLCINLLLIITFFKKECFHGTARYILFAVTLLSDSFILFVTDFLFILDNFKITLNMWLCIIIIIPVYLYSTVTPVTLTAMTLERYTWLCVIISVPVLVYITVTPVTLTAMTLERYVAICMPLRHGELCSTRSTVRCIIIIHGLSSIPCIVIFSTFFASASLGFYKQYQLCSVEIFDIRQSHLRTAIYQLQFLIMCIIIVFSYVKIMKVAKAASGENKKLTTKGLKTVVLHGFQLLLCLIQLWCPFIEAAILNISLFKTIRYMNYILFYLAPKCLSPLIYGIRDGCFFNALKIYASFGMYTRNVIRIAK